MLMSNVLLQKPSKSKNHQLPLENRLVLWNKEKFEELRFEDKTVQAFLKTIQKPLIAEIFKKFIQYTVKDNISLA